MAAKMGVYVHWPYCPSKCGYCDFNAYLLPRRPDAFSGYTAALIQEIGEAKAAGELAAPLESCAFGGGTPTMFPAAQLVAVLRALRQAGLRPDAEVTVEANPQDLELAELTCLAQAGVDRLSIGAQTFSDPLLKAIGRLHQASDIERAVVLARTAGIPRINLDLMYGLPGQSLADLIEALDRTIALGVGHVSAYALELEPATVFGRRAARGELVLPEDEAVVEMGDLVERTLVAAGFHRYEVSNYAKAGQESRHNLAVWRRGRYRGFGAGAHSFLGERRFWNVASPLLYSRRLAAGERVVLGQEDVSEVAMGEWVYLSLRMLAIDTERFSADFGQPWREAFPEATRWAVEEGWLFWQGPLLVVARERRWLINQIAERFLEEGVKTQRRLTRCADAG